MAKRIIGVTQLNEYLKSVIDAEELLKSIGVRGEISGLKMSGTTAFFTLKDADSQLSCVYFNYRPEKGVGEGSEVVATGSPSYYVKSSRMSFVVNDLSPVGEGELYREFLLLKEKLKAEGLFDRKIPVPSRPATIGVVTSEDGAVIQDIISVTRRRDTGVNILLFPCKVQGLGAEIEIAECIRLLDESKKADAIIVARGGGSLSDLAAFNTELVARAVANCVTPIVSAVGHETDYTLCDFCADLRVPTPSAAAEVLTTDTALLKRNILNLLYEIGVRVNSRVSRENYGITAATGKLGYLANSTTERARARMLELVRKIAERSERLFDKREKETYALIKTLAAMDFSARETELNGYQARLNATPACAYSQGFVRLRKDGVPIKSAAGINKGDTLTAALHDGRLTLTVEDIIGDE